MTAKKKVFDSNADIENYLLKAMEASGNVDAKGNAISVGLKKLVLTDTKKGQKWATPRGNASFRKKERP